MTCAGARSAILILVLRDRPKKYTHSDNRVFAGKRTSRIVTSPLRAVLTDFGIACAIGGVCPATSTFPGTPAYVAPERLDGGECRPESDLFSLGATLFMLWPSCPGP